MMNKKSVITKIFLKPNENLEDISNKYKFIKHSNIQVDWEDPDFVALWEDPRLQKIISHDSRLLDVNPSSISKKLEIAQKLNLNDSELNSLNENFYLLRFYDNSDISERINILRKIKLEDTGSPVEIKGFHEQFDAHKKVLTEIKNRVIDETVEGFRVFETTGKNGFFNIDTPPSFFQEPGVLFKPRKFMIEDLTNLKLNLADSSGTTRIKYLQDLDKDALEGSLEEICAILNHLGIHPEVRNTAIENLLANIGKHLKDETFTDSIDYVNKILEHPDIEEIVDKLSSMFIKVPINFFENLNKLIDQHEFLTFCSIEPYMISVVGNALFFKILLPLHRQGAFSLLMAKVMVDVSIKKMDTFQYMKHKSREIYPILLKYGLPIVPFFLGQEVIISDKPTIVNVVDPIEENETKKPLSEKIREKDKALGFSDQEGKEYLLEAREFVYRAGVEAGKTIGKFGKGIIDGVVSENQDDIADVVEALEDAANSQKDKKEKEKET